MHSIFRSPFENIKKVFVKNLFANGQYQAVLTMFSVSKEGKWAGQKSDLQKDMGVPKHMMESLDKIYGTYLKSRDEKDDNYDDYGRVTCYVSQEDTPIASVISKIYSVFRAIYFNSGNISYFKNMNKEQFEKTLTLFYECCMKYYNFYEHEQTLCRLTWLHGPKKMVEYLEYFRDYFPLMPRITQADYTDYIRLCFSVKNTLALQDTRIRKWRIEDWDEISMEHDNMTNLYNAKKEIGQYGQEKQEKFNQIKQKWDKYLYSEDEFSIIYPETISDIATEGYKLHHCVKSYINDVINERTNILFIRRTNDLSKPFYTLEIKDDVIRQCHGFNNCNISEVKGLKSFLKRFCKKKNVTFADMDRCLAVGL
jgi:hypothetical protein